ncbi:GntR family transcriptional regulator [Companilactobacillus sp.]|uniref:GntR family transcriptional regulator n=1 Tax=Companilactobacillus sp. TaxID=2767905 RepID=UPI0025BD8D8A|nr:GntR family transcriptional regulator [Companilactobacillus sp.]MCH4008557.1 GntR family transcriptional regulator [Companilactobacillus sp.]MCH4051264.1 GntR family transcriptional regulator [Companilactobacillus sp.]MCH4076500.1 GntR family transcriptional regulator [Companilactobacillus sp.]MCH4125075.1 GntR family transcriptional regulator [Companilactobacillus sp.]MCH4131616.1 GntR family transcriptional regulator [Companilactobacillus sp.]
METKYEMVENDLKEKILSGSFAINDKLPTESEMMKTYQVSRYTIRRAISDLESEHYLYTIQGGGMFVDDWQKQVEQTPLESKQIGVITTHIADYIFPNIITGIDRYVSSKGYSVLISNTQNDPQKERTSLKKMIDSNLSGLIIEPTQSALGDPNKDLYQKIKESGLPTVFINSHYQDLDFPYVEMNDIAAGKQVTDALFNMGHERILGIFKIDDGQGVHRMNGYIKSYQGHNQFSYLSEIVMYQSSDNMHSVFSRIEAILRREDRPTAIVCYNDQLAIQVINLIRSLKLNVPKDVSVIAFDNYQLSKYISPKLSTVEHPKEQMGRDAAKMMFDQMENKTIEKYIMYEPEMILRESTKNRA